MKSRVDQHANLARRGGEQQQAVEPGDVVRHEDRAALLRDVLALIDANLVDRVRDQPGQEFDRGLRDQDDDVDEHGHGRQAAEEEDLSRAEFDAHSRRAEQPINRPRRSACRRR